jgi:hypothetical protein
MTKDVMAPLDGTPMLAVAAHRASQLCQNNASRMMIGSGIPSSHNSNPLPKPMMVLLGLSYIGQTSTHPRGRRS